MEVTKANGPRGAVTLLIRPETPLAIQPAKTALADLLARADALAKPAGRPLGRP